MRLTKWTDYTLRVLMHCAATQKRAKPVTIQEIAERHDISERLLAQCHLKGFGTLAPQDVQATLTALTAQACAQDVLRHAPEVYEVLVCGGGALNRALMRQLSDALPGKDVITTQMRGMPPMQVEATAFAWLARQTLLGRPGNLPAVTGANGQRVLGAIYPR